MALATAIARCGHSGSRRQCRRRPYSHQSAGGHPCAEPGPALRDGRRHIHGVGAGASIIDRHLTSRLFGLESPTARLVLSRLTLRNGNGDFGGALLNKGTAILDRVTLTGNRARNGGGILNAGSLTGLNLTVSGNQATSLNASTGFGGGLNNESGSYGLFASDVSGNSAPYNGGGIYAAGTGTIVNTLFAGNQSGATGGAIDTIRTAEARRIHLRGQHRQRRRRTGQPHGQRCSCGLDFDLRGQRRQWPGSGGWRRCLQLPRDTELYRHHVQPQHGFR